MPPPSEDDCLPRCLIVYPALTRTWERVWRNRHSHLAPAAPIEEPAAGDTSPGRGLFTWAGLLIVLYGAAHTLGALADEGAAT